MKLSVNSKNSFLLISEKIIILSITFFISVLLARVGGPKLFGQYSYITSFTALFIPFTAMGLNNIATKYFVLTPQYSHHIFITTLLLRAIGALTCILIGGGIAFILNNEDQFTYIMTFLVLQSFTLFYIVDYFYLAKNQVLQTLKIRLSVIIFMGIIKIIIILQGLNLYTLLIAHGLEFVLIGSFYIALYFKQRQHITHQKHKQINKKTTLELFHKGKWLLLSGISAILYLKIDQVMIAYFQNVEQVAYYAAAAKLSEFWYVFPILIANAFNAKLIKLKQKNNKEYQDFLLQILSVMVVFALVISLLIFIFASPIISLIYGVNYQTSASILSIHIFATLFIFQRAILSKWLIIEANYKFSLYSHGAGALSNIGLNIVLIPLYGGLGAAWATLFSYMVASFLSLLFTKQTRKFMRLMITAMIKWPFVLANSLSNKTNIQS